MKTPAALLAIAVLLAGAAPALADGTHKHYTFGEPGKPENVTQTITVDIQDSDGKLRFEHAPMSIRKGDVVKFVVTNEGAGDHEFSVGDPASQRAHALMMEKMPDMKHEHDPSAISLKPGETKTLIWAFTKSLDGTIVFACQMPGHYQAGMFSKVKLVK